MSYQDKVDRALALIQEHNEAIGEEKKSVHIDADKFIDCIKFSGGTSEDRLRSMSHEDILDCLPSFDLVQDHLRKVKPKALAKAIAGAWRDKIKEEGRPVSSRKAERLTLPELIEAFDPEESDNPVAEILKKKSKGNAFIVFDTGRQVNRTNTLKLLQELKEGYPPRKDIDVDGKIKKVYKIGNLPDNFAEENPLYSGRPLRLDETCDQTGRSWSGIPLEVRQLIRLAVKSGEVEVSIDKAHDLLDVALQENAFDNLAKRYRNAAVKFDELEGTGDLPKLKVALGNAGNSHPFEGGRKVQFKTTSGIQFEMSDEQYSKNKRDKTRGQAFGGLGGSLIQAQAFGSVNNNQYGQYGNCQSQYRSI